MTHLTPRRRREQRQIAAQGRAARPRIAPLDGLRGLAIVLMIVDHAAYYLWEIPIAPTSLRIATRLSMPLFCVLMGYLLADRRMADPNTIYWRRFYQLCGATALATLIFYTAHQKLEILASLLICYSLFIAVGNALAVGLLAAFATSYDPTLSWFDYPVPLVLSCVAQGIILRRYQWHWALASGIVLTAATLVVPAPSQYVLWYVLPATLLIARGAGQWGTTPAREPADSSRWPRTAGTSHNPRDLAHPQLDSRWQHPAVAWLVWIGRYPLTVYLVQYLVIFALKWR